MSFLISANMKMIKTKERMRATMEANKQAKLNQQQQQPPQTVENPVISDEELVKIFSTGEKVEKTPRNSNKKKKNKSKT